MSKIVSGSRQVLSNIRRFAGELDRNSDLQERLAYARAWYAHRGEDGKWQFGPSKFVGYEGMDAIEYLTDGSDRDGRRTEAQLQQWFTLVDPSTALHEEISAELVAFLARYGKAPSTKMRLNVLNEVFQENQQTDRSESGKAIVDLMVAVAKSLSASDLKILLSRLTPSSK